MMVSATGYNETFGDFLVSGATNGSGAYSLTVPTGSYSLSASNPSDVNYVFSPSSQAAEVAAGNVTGKDFTGEAGKWPAHYAHLFNVLQEAKPWAHNENETVVLKTLEQILESLSLLEDKTSP